MYQQILILVGLILLSSIFSGSETALVSVSQSKVKELASKRVANSGILQKLKSNPHRLLITILIGNNVVNIAASAYAAIVFTERFGSSGLGITTGIMTFLILVFGEITPKSFAHQHAVGVSLWIARPIYYLGMILFPVVWLFEVIVKITNKIVGSEKGVTVTEGEIMAMVKIGMEEGTLEKQERELIENVLEFNDIEVKDVMTPRVAIEALKSDMTLQDAVNFVIRHPYSRLPIYEDNLDHIIGVLSVREVLECFDKYSPMKKLASVKFHKPLEIPYSKKINILFKEFQRKHMHIAVVIDEHGGTAGLVTMEDILEEIVGDIADETDLEDKPIEIIDANTLITKGAALVEDISDYFKIKLSGNERDTLNTLVTDFLHRFPREGEVVKMPLIRVKIQRVKKHMIEKAKIFKRNVRVAKR